MTAGNLGAVDATKNPVLGAAEIAILDVGHGNASVVQENGHCLIVDAASGPLVLDFLESEGIVSIDLIVLSHSDQDHIGGLIAILASGIRVGAIAVNADAQKASDLWDDIAKLVEDMRRSGGVDVKVGISAGKLMVPGFTNLMVAISAPSAYLAIKGVGGVDRRGKVITSNSISACIRISYCGEAVLLLAGDLDAIGLEEALASGEALESPILVFPHHGGGSGGKDEDFVASLLGAVKPVSVVFSMGRNKFLNPKLQIVEAIRKFSARVHIACTQVSKNCVAADQEHVLVANFSGTLKFRRNSASCAGNVRIPLPLSDDNPVFGAAHRAFVVENIANAMCMRNF